MGRTKAIRLIAGRSVYNRHMHATRPTAAASVVVALSPWIMEIAIPSQNSRNVRPSRIRPRM